MSIEYVIKPSKDDTLVVDITSGEFSGMGVRYFNMDFSGLDVDGECVYDYSLMLQEERDFTDEENIRLGQVLDSILSDVVNAALSHATASN